MNKKAFELSVNFIVMLILSIVVFGFGIYFSRMIFSEAENIKVELDANSEARIRSMLDRGERFVIPVSSQTIKSGELATFGIGLLNIDTTDPNGKTFTVEIPTTEPKCNGVTPAQRKIENACSGIGIFVESAANEVLNIRIPPNEQKIIPVAIKIPGNKPKGTYIFTVLINGGTDTNYPPKQLWVNIA